MPQTTRNITRQVAIPSGIALLILLSVLGFAYDRLRAFDRTTAWVDHTHAVIQGILRLESALIDAETGQRGYLLTGQPAMLRSYERAVRAVRPAVASVRDSTSDNPVQQARLDTMETLVASRLALLQETLARRAAGDDAGTLEMLRSGRGLALMTSFRELTTRMESTERGLLMARAEERGAQRQRLTAAMLGGGVAALLLLLAASVGLRRALLARDLAEAHRDEHATEIAAQSQQLEAQNEELTAQGEALQMAIDLADESNRAKSVFLAQMSHELRTPLNSVIGFANIVRRNPRGTLSETELSYLDRVVENGRHLLRTINSILDLAKIEARQESVELVPVSLAALLAEVASNLEPQAAAGSVRLDAPAEGGLAPILTDPDKLRRILVNLVANAIKFTRAGGKVSLRVERDPADASRAVAIEVEDTGVGIAPTRLAAIFEAFEQGDVGVSREFGGTGLGLSISRALCQLLGYELTVRSEVDVGSVFRIALVRAAPARA